MIIRREALHVVFFLEMENQFFLLTAAYETELLAVKVNI